MTTNLELGATTIIRLAESDIYYDKDAMTLVDCGVEVKLDRIVSKLLEYFIENEDKVISREELIDNVWERQQVSNDAINRAVSILRKSLGGKKHRFIKTIPKVGYRFSLKQKRSVTAFVSRSSHNIHFLTLIETLSNFLEKYVFMAWNSFITRLMVPFALVIAVALLLINHESTNTQYLDVTNLGHSELDRTEIVVEPFVNFSVEEQHKYFADGLTEEIENNLARLDGLFVLSPQQEWFTENHKINRRKALEQEGVDYFLSGSIHRESEQLRISVQLIDAQSNTIVFSNIFYQPMADFFQIQEDISRQVASALNLSLIKKHELYSYQASALDFVAIEKLVIARSLVMSYKPKSIKSAVSTLSKLAKSYPKTPEITGLLAFALYQMISQSNESMDRSIDDIILLAEHTLQQDDDNLDALYTLANIYIGFPDWREKGYGILKKLLMHHPGKKSLYQAMLYHAGTLNPNCQNLLQFIDELPKDVLTTEEYSAYGWATRKCQTLPQQSASAAKISNHSSRVPLTPEQLSAIYSLYLPIDELYDAVAWMAKQYPNPRYLAELYDYQLFVGAYESAKETQLLLDNSQVGTWTFTTDLIGFLYGMEVQRMPAEYLDFVNDSYRNASLPGFVAALIKQARATDQPELVTEFLEKVPDFPVSIINRGESLGWIALLYESGQIEKSAEVAQHLLDILNEVYQGDLESYHFWNMAPLRLFAALYAGDTVTAEHILETDFPVNYSYWFNDLESSKVLLFHWREQALVNDYLQRIASDRKRYLEQIGIN